MDFSKKSVEILTQGYTLIKTPKAVNSEFEQLIELRARHRDTSILLEKILNGTTFISGSLCKVLDKQYDGLGLFDAFVKASLEHRHRVHLLRFSSVVGQPQTHTDFFTLYFREGRGCLQFYRNGTWFNAPMQSDTAVAFFGSHAQHFHPEFTPMKFRVIRSDTARSSAAIVAFFYVS